MTDEQIAILPDYKKLIEISRENGACRSFLCRASRCDSYQEAITKEKISLIKWFGWLSAYFTVEASAKYFKVTAPAMAEYYKVTDAPWAEYEKVRDAALIQGVIDSFG